GIDVPERALIELLQDRVLDSLVAFDRAQRLGEGVHDRRGREWVGRGLHLRTPEQIANRPVELEQLVVAQVLDHTDDVSRHDRLVHRDGRVDRSEEHTSELQSLAYLVCRLLLEKKKTTIRSPSHSERR